MKTELEIQRAHDLLVGVLLGETPLKLSKSNAAQISRIASTLCWVLNHDHNSTVGKVLAHLEGELSDMGVVLERRNN